MAEMSVGESCWLDTMRHEFSEDTSFAGVPAPPIWTSPSCALSMNTIFTSASGRFLGFGLNLASAYPLDSRLTRGACLGSAGGPALADISAGFRPQGPGGVCQPLRLWGMVLFSSM